MDIDLSIDSSLSIAAMEPPHVYQALSNFIDIVVAVMYDKKIVFKHKPEQIKALNEEIIKVLDAFKLELVDDSDEDTLPSYNGTQSAYFVAEAYIDLRNNEEHVLTNFPVYKEYVKSKGKAKLSYKDALAMLPAAGTPFYEATKNYCSQAKKSLADIRAARILLRKLFKLIPKDVYRYEDIEKLYNELRNLYAYETVFNFYYM